MAMFDYKIIKREIISMGTLIVISKQLINAGKILDIEILDHIIVSQNSYKSIKELGLL